MRRAGEWRALSTWRATRLRCDCMGYHFPHRKGGGACDASPRRDYYHALRQGVDKLDALALLSADQLARLPA
jgi:hypothetical protein